MDPGKLVAVPVSGNSFKLTEWEAEHQIDFDALKKVCSAHTLAYVDVIQPLVLETGNLIRALKQFFFLNHLLLIRFPTS